MVDQSPSFFDFDDRMAALLAKGDDLERVKALVDFEMFRPALEAAVLRADRSKGGRPAFDHMLMFKVPVGMSHPMLKRARRTWLVEEAMQPRGQGQGRRRRRTRPDGREGRRAGWATG